MRPGDNNSSRRPPGSIVLGFRELRRQTTVAQHEQLTRFRFRHQRQALLASLQERWAAAAPPHSLP